jgi:hypothetical protein
VAPKHPKKHEHQLRLSDTGYATPPSQRSVIKIMKNFLFNQDYPAQSRASGLILSISSEKEGEQSKK